MFRLAHLALLALTATSHVSMTSASSPSMSLRTDHRRVEVLPFQATFAQPTCFMESGFDYVGNDIGNALGPLNSCCDKCNNLNGCKAWSWTNLDGGTCWLKSGRTEVKADPNVKSSGLYDGSVPSTCSLQDNLDYVGNDLARVDSTRPEGCCDLCRNYPGCRAYSWSDLQGGSCWLKSQVTQTIVKNGVKSAEAYPSLQPQSCNALERNVDYVGNNLTSRPSGTPEGCCGICRSVNGCVAFSWSTQSGGTCYLKGFKGKTITNDGVVSSVVSPNPSPCSLEMNVDFVANDIGNAPANEAFACCGICSKTNGCTAFSWTNLNGGMCWLKSSKGETKVSSGATSAVVWAA